MALFAGALIAIAVWRSYSAACSLRRRLFVGFHKLMFVVYASFLVNVVIGLWLRDRRNRAYQPRHAPRRHPVLPRHQFRVWQFLKRLPAHRPGLLACYISDPLFWNT